MLKQIQSLEPWYLPIYNYLHENPELSNQEKGTSAYCRFILESMGYKVIQRSGEGFTADLVQNPKWKTIAFRAEMDALPIQENTGHVCESKNTGIAHACGHDLHMTVGLTAARFLKEQKHKLNVNVRFIFQPAEELPPGGAIGMIQAGSLDGVSEIYGLHNEPQYESGTIATREGSLSASGDIFRITVFGKGCHSARPQEGLNPIPIAATMVLELQELARQEVLKFPFSIVSVTQFHAGEVPNVIPGVAEIAGTVRTLSEEVRLDIENEIRKLCLRDVPDGVRIEVTFQRGYDSIVNNSECVQSIISSALPILGPKNIIFDCPPVTWGEDFCYYLQKCKGAFFLLGSRKPASDFSLHSASFLPNLDSISVGVSVFASLAFSRSFSEQRK